MYVYMYVSKYVCMYVPSMRQRVPRILTGTISANPKILNPISHTSNGSLSPLRANRDSSGYDDDYDDYYYSNGNNYHYNYDNDNNDNNNNDNNNKCNKWNHTKEYSTYT